MIRISNRVTNAGYQFDYVFDWTILKYPQIGSNPRMRVCNRPVFLIDARFVICWTYSICLSFVLGR
jgi:hypothetical protein